MQEMRVSVCPPVESQEALMGLYRWIDQMELSRPKRNINRDFSDGVLMAEVVNHLFPRFADLHNYSAANSKKQKLNNWTTLNNKLLNRLGFRIHQDDVEDIIEAKAGTVERVLYAFQRNIGQIKTNLKSEVRPPTKTLNTSPTIQRKREEGEDIAQLKREVDTDILLEREETIHELKETNIILKQKIKHLEQLVKLKDAKLEALTNALQLQRDPGVSRLPAAPALSQRQVKKGTKIHSPTSSSSSASSPFQSPSTGYLR
eukprot:GHVS01106206.1.p1 GENE.GHVS01106206.1~~GHVS01106206.1.p1  ORF type:complete len:259 (+),score=40.22 GHVS01106206.1:55-831(+)